MSAAEKLLAAVQPRTGDEFRNESETATSLSRALLTTSSSLQDTSLRRTHPSSVLLAVFSDTTSKTRCPFLVSHDAIKKVNTVSVFMFIVYSFVDCLVSV